MPSTAPMLFDETTMTADASDVGEPGDNTASNESEESSHVASISPLDQACAYYGRIEAEHAALLGAVESARERITPMIEGTGLLSRIYRKHGDPLKALQDGLVAREALAKSLWHLTVTQMCEEAGTTFRTPAGLPVEVSEGALLEHFGLQERYRYHDEPRHDAPPRPPYADIWRYLDATYHTEEAADAVERQVVAEFVDQFLCSFGEIEPPTWRRGRLLLTINVHTEAKYSGGHEYTFSSREYITRNLAKLGGMLRVCGVDSLARAVDGYLGYGAFGGELVSRRRIALPADSAFITFKNKLEIEIGEAAAADLMPRVAECLKTRPARAW